MSAQPPLVERKQRQARERIVRAAEELFHEHGFDAVSVSDIAERAEVGRTTFFRHFGNKQEVAFSREQELLDSLTHADLGDTSRRTGTVREALAQLQPIVLNLCARIATDSESYVRHFELIERNPELQAREAIKTQQAANLFSALLTRQGYEQAVATLSGQVALACYQSARRLSGDPRTLVDDARQAFDRLLEEGKHQR
ncbi:TetR/AcrR family transcriptional regulator [Kineosporia mesophila]|uniref:TetR/AcrR family transcriptional regulator n=1 Tax=Kineosporia mesophila TaxID=566012 RepID=A0ABP6ZDS4_9ACTN|nr:TetR family transcriptional regulator [Kineosporia mesophila]MCD5350118.1 TetR/AcrR family transcriptional regulator [Kineosporia mesophila]